jgi:BNR repeat-like domain
MRLRPCRTVGGVRSSSHQWRVTECALLFGAFVAAILTFQVVDAQTSPIPGYTNYAAPNGLGNNGGEPSIGINWHSGRVLVQANTQTLRVSFNDAVSPATAAWEDKSATPPRCTAATSFDPILFTDHTTGRTFESQLIPTPALTSLTCFSDTDGDSWTPSEGGGIGSGIDHQTLGGGPFAPASVGPIGAYADAVYYCSQDVGAAFCSLSRDGGLTFTPAVPIYTATACGGLHGHVKVAPDGTVYVPNKACGGTALGHTVQAVVVATDNGLTWSVRPVPTSSTGISDPSVGIGANGTVYFGYQNGDGHAHVAVSRDRGQTWSNDQDVGASFSIQNSVFPAVVAGDDNRAAFAFLGTPTAGDFQSSTFAGIWHLYIADSYDGGSSWTTVDATPNDPVQRNCIWLSGGSNACRNLLDFMDTTVDQHGRVLVAYADGCIDECVTSAIAPGPSAPVIGYRTKLATIARQSAGKGLLAAFD